MNVTVFVSVISALSAFAGALVAVLGAAVRTPWWKRRQAEKREREEERAKAEAERHKRQDAMAELVTAQLNTNGGGSFLDKMNATKEDVGALKRTVAEMSRTMVANAGKIDDLGKSIADNHTEGQDDLKRLHAEDKAIESQLMSIRQKTDVLQAAADGLQRMADDLSVRLPEALGVQDRLVRDVDSLKERMERAEKELFGD